MPFPGGPVQDRRDSAHVRPQLFGKLSEWLFVPFLDDVPVLRNPFFNPMLCIQKLLAMFRGERLIRVQQKVAYVGSRCIDFRPKPLQYTVARHVILADLFFAYLNLRQEGDRADTQNSQQKKKTPESQEKHQSGLPLRRSL